MRILMLMSLCFFTGCSVLARWQSSSADLLPTDAAFIADEVAAYVASVLPPASSTLTLTPPARSPSLVESVNEKLRLRGFAVANSDASNGHALRYDATPMDDGVLVQIVIDQVLASRWYSRSADGGLVPTSALTVRDSK